MNVKASVFSNGLKVKYSGFRIICDHDVGELIQCHRHFDDLDLQSHNTPNKSKRSHDDETGNNNGSGNCGSGTHLKRLKVTMDQML